MVTWEQASLLGNVAVKPEGTSNKPSSRHAMTEMLP